MKKIFCALIGVLLCAGLASGQYGAGGHNGGWSPAPGGGVQIPGPVGIGTTKLTGANAGGGCPTASSLGFKLDDSDEWATLIQWLYAAYLNGGGCLFIDGGKTLGAYEQVRVPNSGSINYGIDSIPITSITSLGTTATVTFNPAAQQNWLGWAGLATGAAGQIITTTGDYVDITGNTGGSTALNGAYQITKTGANTFTYTFAGCSGCSSTGSPIFYGGFPWKHPPFRITGAGQNSDYSDALNPNYQPYPISYHNMPNLFGSELDLRYHGDYPSHVAFQSNPATGIRRSKRIDYGSGRDIFDNLTILTNTPVTSSSRQDAATFIHVNLAALDVNSVTFYGSMPTGSTIGYNDFITMGGINQMATLTGSWKDRFSSYGSQIVNSQFHQGRRALYEMYAAANEIVFDHNLIGGTCGNLDLGKQMGRLLNWATGQFVLQ